MVFIIFLGQARSHSFEMSIDCSTPYRTNTIFTQKVSHLLQRTSPWVEPESKLVVPTGKEIIFCPIWNNNLPRLFVCLGEYAEQAPGSGHVRAAQDTATDTGHKTWWIVDTGWGHPQSTPATRQAGRPISSLPFRWDEYCHGTQYCTTKKALNLPLSCSYRHLAIRGCRLQSASTQTSQQIQTNGTR